jgi:2-phospho-L-lactate guanylyltransferase (CobY/MobA/RfbA family)
MMTIVVPCKSLKLGKSRLAGVVAPEEREALCRRFLSDTLRLATAVAGAQRSNRRKPRSRRIT